MRRSPHAVHFYRDSESLAQVAATFLCEGINGGERVAVISTPTHLSAIVKAVEARGVDVAQLTKSGRWLAFDARQTLSTLMAATRLEPERVKAYVEDTVAGWYALEPRLSMRTYGEMVDLLCRAGNFTAAADLEDAWTDLAASHKLPLLCAYSVNSFFREPPGSSRFSDVCRRHSHVIGAIPERAI